MLDAQGVDSGWVVRTNGGSVQAKWEIVATNAYTTDVCPEIQAELVHLPYFNLATKPLGENLRKNILPERQGVWDTNEVLSSFRFDRGRLVFGSVGAPWSRTDHPSQLADVAFEYEWYGSIGMTSNNLPRFHKLARGVVSFSGYNGRGIAPGTAFGRTLARFVLGEVSDADLPLPVTKPEAVRIRAVKEAYYEVGAQVVHAVTARF